jgi:GlpG protein
MEARGMFRRFIGNPDAPDFRRQSRERPRETRIDLGAATTLAKGVSALQPGQVSGFHGLGPLSLALAFGCALLGLVSMWGSSLEMLAPLYITSIESVGSMIQWKPGLPEIRSGEVWRIWSPMLIHFGFMHLLFNMLWFVTLGSMVEVRESTRRLMLLILLVGGASNLAQFWLAGPYFGGMSGVVYGLLGYAWMKCRYQPESGYQLSMNSVTLMMIWYFLCLLEIIPQAANTAHTVGLLAGFILGYLSARLGRRT